LRKRTKAREIALQALHQWHVQGDDFRAAAAHFVAGRTEDPDVREFAESLASGAWDHRQEIDAHVGELARHWSLARMAAIDRSILRLAAYEILFREDVPPKVSVDEAVNLAKKFSTADSGAFVNGVLDRMIGGRGKAASRAAGRAPETAEETPLVERH